MAKKRTHYRYELRDRRRIVYVGITDDAERREAEHQRDGKRFTSMSIVGPRVTEETAEDWEGERLEKYRRSHGGKLPKYNRQ